MNRILVLLLVLAAAGAEENTKPKLTGMTWLAGNWSGEMWGGIFHAHYGTPSHGKLLSYSRLMKGEKLAFHEFEVFSQDGDAVTLTPHPGGRPARTFQMTEAGKSFAVFENPKNDFPTKLRYERASKDLLVVTLTDPHNKSDKKQVFKLKRAP